MFIVLVYDIVSDHRRNRVAKEMENWGQRVQHSVFECDLDETRIQSLIEVLKKMTHSDDDVRLYRLCVGCLGKSITVRGGRFRTDPDFYQI